MKVGNKHNPSTHNSVGSYAIGEILLYFFVVMERYFDGTDQDNSNLCIFAANKKFNKAQLEFWSAPDTEFNDEAHARMYHKWSVPSLGVKGQ
jgi:hypothetical protein